MGELIAKYDLGRTDNRRLMPHCHPGAVPPGCAARDRPFRSPVRRSDDRVQVNGQWPGGMHPAPR
jgi:hypothetical protein